MENRKSLNILLYATFFAYFIMSVDFLLMPIGISNPVKNYRALDIITGLIFWIGLIAGITLFVLYSKKCKKLFEQSSLNTASKKRIGLISFFSNRAAMISDIVCILSLILFAVLMIFTKRTAYICYIVLAILVFSFVCHCILNGRAYFKHQKLNEISSN
ncbi:MAG: hypothetical protein IJ927_05390 [Eubacterium sp.]|nr:hypothetical protein [Eubacterium sp.]